MEKVLIIKHGALGDFILAIGTMMTIAKIHPDAEITLMTSSPFVSLGGKMGIFKNYIIDNRGSYFNVREMRRIMHEVTSGCFSYIYDVQGSRRVRKKYFPVIRWLMPHSYTWIDACYDNECCVVKSHRYSFGHAERKKCVSLYTLTDLSFLHGENKHFDELPEKYVMLIPGCSPGHPHKRWPVANYCELVRRLEHIGISSVIIGTNAEAEEINAIAASSPMAVSMLNKTSLMDVPDLARRALATVGNDTGPSHMASLAGVPTIAIYDNRTKQGVLRGLRSVNLVSPSTIDLITVDQVWEAITPFLPPTE